MKSKLQITAALAVIILTSCSGGLSGGSAPSQAKDPAAGFYDQLASEYTNLAAYERDFMQDEEDSLHFTAKARRVLRQQEVEPDLVEQRNIPNFAKEELADARGMLVDALETLRVPGNEGLLAMAQTRYDCWLTHQEDFPQKDAWISCKQGFYDALALLDIPKEEEVTYSIYFEQGGTSLDEEAMDVASKIADHYRDRDQWNIVLIGHTDGKGSKSQNQVLSMRRAIAVKNMLGQHGIDLDNIAISAEGEAKDGEGKGRRVDVLARPHYVAQNKEGLTVLPGWQHSGEF